MRRNAESTGARFEGNAAMWHAWTIGFSGLWCILVAFLTPGKIDGFFIMLLLSVISGFAGWRLRQFRPVQGWCTMALALWLILAALLPPLVEAIDRQWSAVATGVVMAVMGFTSLGGALRQRSGTGMITGAGGTEWQHKQTSSTT